MTKINDRAEACLDWIESMEHPNGGIRGTVDQPAYPEVTGYLVDKLFSWGRNQLAVRCADWLVSIQHPEGYYTGWKDNVPRSFDTAMVSMGLAIANSYRVGDYVAYDRASLLARDWIWNNTIDREAGYMTESNDPLSKSPVYTIFGGAVIGYMAPFWSRRFTTLDHPLVEKTRLHYIAYAMEGLYGYPYHLQLQYPLAEAFATKLDKPFRYWYTPDMKPSGEVEVLGNLQMSIILNDKDLFMSMAKTQRTDGSFPHLITGGESLSWTARYFLEAAWHFSHNL